MYWIIYTIISMTKGQTSSSTKVNRSLFAKTKFNSKREFEHGQNDATYQKKEEIMFGVLPVLLGKKSRERD